MSIASEFQHRLAANHVRKGGVIAYATESVWGLGCDPYNEAAIEQLLALKQRERSKGLILLSGQAEHFEFLTRYLSGEAKARFEQANSRPTTWLVPDELRQVSLWVKGDHDFVALRVSSSPSVAKLTKKLGHAIISTSANPSGKPTAFSALDLKQYFGDALDYILPGKVQTGALPSQIINIATGQIIRA